MLKKTLLAAALLCLLLTVRALASEPQPYAGNMTGIWCFDGGAEEHGDGFRLNADGTGTALEIIDYDQIPPRYRETDITFTWEVIHEADRTLLVETYTDGSTQTHTVETYGDARIHLPNEVSGGFYFPLLDEEVRAYLAAKEGKWSAFDGVIQDYLDGSITEKIEAEGVPVWWGLYLQRELNTWRIVFASYDEENELECRFILEKDVIGFYADEFVWLWGDDALGESFDAPDTTAGYYARVAELLQEGPTANAVYRDGDFTYRVVDGGAVLDDWDNWTEEEAQSVLTIPDTLGGWPVTGIGCCALETCFGGPLRTRFEIVIPEGVTYLEESAFECCSNASVIRLPSTLKTIPEGCFIHVRADIVFPNGNPHFTAKDGFLVDERTETLLHSAGPSESQPLPPVKRLGDHCLDNWLWGEDGGIDDPLLPDTLTSIGSGVFYDLPDLTRVTLPDSITQLDPQCFFCTELQSICLPASLTEVPPYCFMDCSLTSVKIPEGVTRIGEYAFYWNWESIPEVTLPQSVTFIGYNAFSEECRVTALNPDAHFETLEEYQLRCPDGEW